MDELSVKVIPKMPTSLDIPQGSMGPSDKDVMAQLSSSHPIQISEAKYADYQLNLNSQMIRNHHGIGAQLKYMMELKSARPLRLPFMSSRSQITRDILLGLDEVITPGDIYNAEFPEKMSQPHAVMEKMMGVL